MNLYQQELMDHYRNPRNRGTLEHADFVSDEYNPSCGDSVQISGIIVDGTIAQLMFTGEGCVVSQATSSMLTVHCIGKTIDEVKALNAQYINNLVGIPLGPTRLKCALLPLQALQQSFDS